MVADHRVILAKSCRDKREEEHGGAHADATSGEQLVNDFTARHDAATREAAHPDLDAGARALLAGLLSELQQIRAALVAMRDSDDRAATR